MSQPPFFHPPFFTSFAPRLALALLLLVCACLPSSPVAAKTSWAPLVSRLTADGFDAQEMHELFARADLFYTPAPMRSKLRTLFKITYRGSRIKALQKALSRLGYDPGPADGVYGDRTAAALTDFLQQRKLNIDDTPSRELLKRVESELPAKHRTVQDKKGWTSRVYPVVKKNCRRAEARAFYVLHRAYFDTMEKTYGVPGVMAAGIMSVETRMGNYLGSTSALCILASMSLDNTYERAIRFFEKGKLNKEQQKWLKGIAKKRGDWAYNELKALLLYAKTNKRDPVGIPGSIYGAIGISQFMPSNISKYGKDGDKDGDVDLFTPPDAIHSIGSYLKEYGWKGKMTNLSRKREVLYGYNRSQRYVNSVMHMAEYLQKAFIIPEKKIKQRVVKVTNTLELFAAIAPNTRVELAPGAYILDEGAFVPNQYVTWPKTKDGVSPLVSNVPGLTLAGDVEAVFQSKRRHGPLLAFSNCDNLLLRKLKLERTQTNAAGSLGAALEISDCSGANVQFSIFSGGEQGLVLKNVTDFAFRHGYIQLMHKRALTVADSQNLLFKDVTLADNSGDALVSLRNAHGVKFSDSMLIRNHQSSEKGEVFSVTGDATTLDILGSCVLKNSFSKFVNTQSGVRSKGASTSGNSFRVK